MSFLKPGSKEAQEAGCLCPVLDNHHGAGYMGKANVYVYNATCPVHNPSYQKDKKDDKT